MKREKQALFYFLQVSEWLMYVHINNVDSGLIDRESSDE